MVGESVAPPETPSGMETFEFSGARGPFLGLLLINLLLTILTLGVYRFWAKTKVRKFFWSNIRFLGDPLEYTGKGSELLLGFLIVLAVLFPLGFIYDTIGRLVPPGETALRISLEVGYYLVLFALIQIGFYRAWRYRMSRTTWRGIRLGLDGSTWTFLRLSFGWTIVTALTLGLAYPWMSVELWRYQITHTRLGDTSANLKASGKQLFSVWLFIILPVWLLGSLILSIAIESQFDLQNFKRMATDPYLDAVYMKIIVYGSPGLVLASVSLFFLFKLRLLSLVIRGINLGTPQFVSTLPVARLMLFGGLAVVATILIAAAIAALVMKLDLNMMNLLIADSTNSSSSQFVLFWTGFSVITILAYFVLSPFIWAFIYQFELIKQIFITTTVTNPEALESVIQSASESQKMGEGLADALDIGGL